jgi:hypothetical protein
MSSAQEGPAGRAGTTDPTGSSGATGAGRQGPADTGSTSTGTPGYERVGAHRSADYRETAEYEETLTPGRAGFTWLAAVLMIFSGLVTFFYGIVGIIHGSFFLTQNNYIFYFSPRGRGIVDLILGAVIFAAGVSLLLGMLWARIVGVVLAVLTGIYNFMIIPWYPVWSILIIALNVFIVWALLTGGGRSARRLVLPGTCSTPGPGLQAGPWRYATPGWRRVTHAG